MNFYFHIFVIYCNNIYVSSTGCITRCEKHYYSSTATKATQHHFRAFACYIAADEVSFQHQRLNERAGAYTEVVGLIVWMLFAVWSSLAELATECEFKLLRLISRYLSVI